MICLSLYVYVVQQTERKREGTRTERGNPHEKKLKIIYCSMVGVHVLHSVYSNSGERTYYVKLKLSFWWQPNSLHDLGSKKRKGGERGTSLGDVDGSTKRG